MVTIYLSNSIPNNFLTVFDYTGIKKITEREAFELLTIPDHTQEYDDHIAPCVFKPRVKSIVGHQSTADIISAKFTEINNSHHIFKPIKFHVPVNREFVTLQKTDVVIACLTTTITRLPEGQLWSEQQLLEMPINWIMLYNREQEQKDHDWRYEMTQFA